MIDRWIINKLGLLNFWYYDEEEFDLEDGKLLFRGSNGSGKSVTMQSFIPLLLDGNKRPERLDPFGTTARKIENYLLVYPDENERTAYLYMEFKKRDSDVYITIGMGLKAVKGKNVDSWYFIITDGRRVRKDINLYTDKGYKTPLTKKELENRIGSGGFYTDSQNKYKEKVNEYLFGYSDIESYEELISLLINIRTPKLSKDFKPTAMYEILENSLRQLTEDDLRPMSEAMENMDNIKLRIEQLEYSLKAANQINGAYSKYNNFILTEKAKAYLDKHNSMKEQEKGKIKLEKEIEEISKEIDSTAKEVNNLSKELRVAESKIEEYKDSDILKSKDKLEKVKIEIEELKRNKRDKDKALEQKKELLRAKENDEKDIKDKIYRDEIAQDNILDELSQLSEEFYFKAHDAFKEELDINFIKAVFEKYREKIRGAKGVVFKYEKIKEEFERVLQERDNKKNDVDVLDRKLLEAEEYFTTVKEEHVEKFVKWNRSNIELQLDSKIIQPIIREIMGLTKYSQIHTILQSIPDSFNNIKGELTTQKQLVKSTIDGFYEEINIKKDKIEELKNAKEVEFVRDKQVIENRKKLNEMGIPWIPLYKAIDFTKGVKEEDKKYIESALVDMGLIDALIIPEKYKEQVLSRESSKREGGYICDKYLFGTPNFLALNLTEYLSVETSELNGIKYEEVDDVLRSMFLDKSSSTYIDEKGNYGLGILKGRATGDYETKYIGAAARKQHREKLIEEIKKEIVELQEKSLLEINKMKVLEERIQALEKEYNSLPPYEDLGKAMELIDEQSSELKNAEKALDEIKIKYTKIEDSLREIKKILFEATEGLEFEKSYKAYEDAEETAADYKDYLTKFEINFNGIKESNERVNIIEENIESLNEDIDGIIYEINIKNRNIEEGESQRKVFEELLSKNGYEEIKEELDRCYKITQTYPQSINSKKENSATLSERLRGKIQSIEQKENELASENKILEILCQIFIEEYNLAYVFTEEVKNEKYRLASEVLKTIELPQNKSKENYDSELFESYNRNNGILRDYQPKIITILKKEVLEENLRAILQASERKDIMFRVNGKEVNFNILMTNIKRDLEENRLLLTEREREFFQDILLKTISNKIRAKIHYSNVWVKSMNELMQSMETTSSFKLTLRWVPKKAESEGQLDTNKLVEILSKEQGLIRAEDIEELSKHFATKVKDTIRANEDNKESKNYFTVIKEILDYRKWYEFKLFSKKEGETIKELTNNAFFQLSGGEKAMAMYIPLFTAVYSRYDIADKKDCPRIVSLDEAFAGVDEENIRDMFRILKEMKLDYILNSQILWGDYDSVDNLAICEIVRPDNADYVTVIRYKWNGKEKICLV